MTVMAKNDYLARLRQMVQDRFDESELRTLCFDLHIDYENLLGQSKADKARELVAYLKRHDRVPDLAQVVGQSRPDIPWEDISESAMPPIAQGPPNNLPRKASEFVGRKEEKQRIYDALHPCSRSRLISIDGTPGMGKTSLALEVAHESLQAAKGKKPDDNVVVFDGYIWATAKDQELDLDDLLDTVARTLGYPDIVQKQAKEKYFAVCRLLRSRQYLLIVDNFETVTDAQVRDFLLNLPEPSQALITTREQRLADVWSIPLKRLTEPEGLELIREAGKRLGLVAMEQAEEEVLLHLYHATGGAPMAITWALGQIKQRGQSLDTVLAALREARGDIFESMFDRSWTLLSENARQVLLVIPLFAASASRVGIEATSNVHHHELDEALGQLVQMCLVEAIDEPNLSQRRYSIHPLTRAFATAKRQKDTEADKAAQKRCIDYLKDLCKVERYEYYFQYNNKSLRDEGMNILFAFKRYLKYRIYQDIFSLASASYQYLDMMGDYNGCVDLCKEVLDLAGSEHRAAAACFSRMEGWVLAQWGRNQEAESRFSEALKQYRQLEDLEGQSLALREMSMIHRKKEEYGKARDFCNQAWTIAEGLSIGGLKAMVNIERGKLARDTKDWNQAWRHFSALQDWFETWDEQMKRDNVLVMSVYDHLALVAYHLGRPQEAKELCLKSIAFFQSYGGKGHLATVKYRLALAKEALGERDGALEHAQEAMDWFERLDMKSDSYKAKALLERLHHA